VSVTVSKPAVVEVQPPLVTVTIAEATVVEASPALSTLKVPVGVNPVYVLKSEVQAKSS
jgi:hypothetical protein